MKKFSKTRSKIILTGIICGFSFFTAGCIPLVVGAAAGAGGVIWARGALQQEFNKPLDRVYEAAKTALKKLDLPIEADKKDHLSAKLESEFADGKRVTIEINYLSMTTTKVSIRAGALGDEIRSREISEMIIKYL